jgi:hypothetical protein
MTALRGAVCWRLFLFGVLAPLVGFKIRVLTRLTQALGPVSMNLRTRV